MNQRLFGFGYYHEKNIQYYAVFDCRCVHFWMASIWSIFFILWSLQPEYKGGESEMSKMVAIFVSAQLLLSVLGSYIAYKTYQLLERDLMSSVSKLKGKYAVIVFTIVWGVSFFAVVSCLIYLMRPWYYARFPSDADTDSATFVAVVWCIKLIFSLLGVVIGYKLYRHTEQSLKNQD